MSDSTIGFIGLGVMGEPMCRNIMSKSGRKVRVLDLDVAPVQRLVGLGAEAAANVAALVRGCDVVLAPAVSTHCSNRRSPRAWASRTFL